MVDKDRVISLLAAGVSPVQVASSVGCSPSYITQLMSEDDYVKDQVAKKKIAKISEHIQLDEIYDRLEAKLAKKLETALVFEQDPVKIAKMLQMVNGLKRKNSGVTDVGTAKPVSTVTLPAVLVQQFILNGNNQAVQIGDQTLLTLPSHNLDNLAAKRIPVLQDQRTIDI